MMNEKLQSIAMSSENGFQKSQVSASSNIRKKVDILNGRENRDSKEKVLPDSMCNLRMSLAWDSAFFTSPGVLEPEELFTALNSRNYDNVVNILGNEEHLLQSSQSLEPDTNTKAENYNYRQSLAWDNGFFTSEGVLNPFELAIVNNGLKKSESHLLPVIEDEILRSIESNNTFDREGSSLTRLEMDLFEDIGASIHKPISSRFEPGRPGFLSPIITSSAELDSSRTMIKTMPACKRQSINKHGSKKIMKEMPKTPKIQLKHKGESREQKSSSSLKPFKTSEQTTYVSRSPTKMASLGEKHTKPGSRSGVSASVEGLGKLKKPCLRQSLNSIHGSTHSHRSPLSHCTTSDATRRPPSEITIRKAAPTFTRKINSRHSNVLVTGSSSTPPLMKAKGSKTEVESSRQSTPTSSWYGSPASSIDEWPSELSTTQRTNKCKRDAYLRSSLMENESVVNPRHRKDRHKEDGNADTSNILREVKPSGLRMPSPKLGYFDAENMLEVGKRDAVSHRTKVQCPRNRNRKKGGTAVVCASATKGNKSPTVKIMSPYSALDDNKENEYSFDDRQIEGLAKQLNSVGLKSDPVLCLCRRN